MFIPKQQRASGSPPILTSKIVPVFVEMWVGYSIFKTRMTIGIIQGTA